MCECCSEIVLRDSFYSPQDYLNCLNYIKTLITDKKFVIVKQTCDLGCVKNENDCWVGDIIVHEIKCKKCGKHYIVHCDTYHGHGDFSRV